LLPLACCQWLLWGSHQRIWHRSEAHPIVKTIRDEN